MDQLSSRIMQLTAKGLPYQSARLVATREIGTRNDLSSLSQENLLTMRNILPPDDPLQQKLAPYEHGAYAREATMENPAMALPIAVATPMYYLAKKAGIMGSRTPASLEQVYSGFRGVGEGLMNYWRNRTTPSLPTEAVSLGIRG